MIIHFRKRFVTLVLILPPGIDLWSDLIQMVWLDLFRFARNMCVMLFEHCLLYSEKLSQGR